MNYYSAVALGQAGCVVRSSSSLSSAITPPAGRFWNVIQILGDTKFHTLTNTIASGDSLANSASSAIPPTIGAGTCLYGNFTEIRIYSGTIVAYFGI